MLETFKPYLVRAVYEWCLDNSETPHIAVRVGESLPPGIADENGMAVLNIEPSAVRNLKIGSDRLSFTARFKGKVHEVGLDYRDVLVVFGKESGRRLVLSAELPQAATDMAGGRQRDVSDSGGEGADKPHRRGKPDIKVY